MAHYHEHIKRSVAKALTFRSIVVTSDVIIVYAITRQVDLTLGVLVFSNLSSTLIYFLHERFWNGVHWGKESHVKKSAKKR